jgi:hypothetical protein
VNKHNITGFTVLCDAGESIPNIFTRWFIVLAIIHQNQHVLFLKALLLDEESFNVLDVIMASTELSLLT